MLYRLQETNPIIPDNKINLRFPAFFFVNRNRSTTITVIVIILINIGVRLEPAAAARFELIMDRVTFNNRPQIIGWIHSLTTDRIPPFSKDR